MDDKIKRFLRAVFSDEGKNDPVCRNLGCRFTDSVLDYLAREWSMDLTNYAHDTKVRAMDMIDAMNGKENVPNTAARIAMEVIPPL